VNKAVHQEKAHSIQTRQEIAAFGLGFFADEILRQGGLAFGIQDEANRTIPKCVVVVCEYDGAQETNRCNNPFAKLLQLIQKTQAYWIMYNDPVGIPKVLDDRVKMKKLSSSLYALEPVMESLTNLEDKYGPQETHLYIALVGTDLDGQGKGYGRRAMTLLGQAADDIGMACYLECPDNTVPFFEKCGYTLTKSLGGTPEDLNFGDRKGNFCLMTRQARV
jgi:GNAT superfamily N-acetyltransferase